MAGSPKGGFPARRPGKLFGKKQMVMFGCIVLVLFVAPSLFGIGDTTAKKIMAETGLENKRVREFEEEELTTLRAEVDKYMIEGDLRRFNMMNIKRLKEIQCYRGRRHIQGLPMRGQRTKTNARTRKGKTKTVAGKKK